MTYVLSEEPFWFAAGFGEPGFEHDLFVFTFFGVFVDQGFEELFLFLQKRMRVGIEVGRRFENLKKFLQNVVAANQNVEQLKNWKSKYKVLHKERDPAIMQTENPSMQTTSKLDC